MLMPDVWEKLSRRLKRFGPASSRSDELPLTQFKVFVITALSFLKLFESMLDLIESKLRFGSPERWPWRREALAVPGIRLAARYHKKMPYPRTKSLCASSAKKTAAHGIQEPDKFFLPLINRKIGNAKATT